MFEVKFDRHQGHIRSLLKPKMQVTVAMGRRTGKTFFSAAEIHEVALSRPRSRIGLLMPSLIQAKKTFWIPYLIPQLTGPLKPYVKRTNMTDLTCEYTNGSRLTTWGAENAQSIRGQGFDFLVEDEADDIDPSVETAVVAPTLMESGSEAIWLRCGTPTRGRNGTLYHNFQCGQEGTRERVALGADAEFHASYRCSSEDSERVDQRALAREKRKLIARGQLAVYEREYQCNFDSAEGLVYASFERDLHVREPDTTTVQWSEILVGIDHGFEDPAVFLVVGVMGNGRDAVCWVIDEVYDTHLQHTDLQKYAKKIQEVYAPRCDTMRWYADPSRPDMIGMYRGCGIRAEEAKNAIDDGVMTVADRIYPRAVERPTGATYRTARLYVSPRCINTIREIETYRRKRDPKDADRVLDVIEDKNNHAMDALRYALFTRFGKPPATRMMYDPYGGGSQE